MKQIDWEQREWDLAQELAITLTADGELSDPEEIASMAVYTAELVVKQFKENK